MNKRELARFKKLIDEEQQRVRSTLGDIEAEISDRSASQAGGGQGYSNHMADVGSDAMEQEQAFMHASQETEYLQQLDEALKRIERGIYGDCDDCGEKIPVKRLEAYPAAKLCVSCKSKLERLKGS